MSSNPLTPERFEEFFRAVNGADKTPFPWQCRMAARAAAPPDPARPWPQALALPTASGKTTCLDIAIFALACQTDLPPETRTAPRRIFFVVDRRVIVDEAYEHAKRIGKCLREPDQPILREVADALRRLAGTADDAEAPPLDCFQLRGGVYRDDAWARTPTQPTIIASTVDQIGSRLLFRGYGVSPGMRPIHAGLAANDSLLILDEAHCAQPFMQTLLAVQRYRLWAEKPLPSPFHVVLLSATPPSELKDIESAGDDDRADPVLGPRLHASKPARLVVAEKASGKKAVEQLAPALVAEALALAKDDLPAPPSAVQSDLFAGGTPDDAAVLTAGASPKAVAIIVNRVATARAAYRLLQEKAAQNKNFGDVVLLMGRMRPVDRDAVVGEWLTKLNAKSAKGRALERPVYVVATQCLEVGADLDFDAMVSECAALDSLRQRFGRLNRTGRRIPARATIVIRADQTEPVEPVDDGDPIYGNALALTWQWLKLKSRETGDVVDFGVEPLRALLDEDFATDPEALKLLLAPSADAPVLLPAYVDCWAQTNPEPEPDPEPALFLHGPQGGVADVRVCWRADLPIQKKADGETKQENKAKDKNEAVEKDDVREESELWKKIVSFCPPASAELMPVPFTVFRRWFAGEDAEDTHTGDMEGSAEDESPERPVPTEQRIALRWLGPERSELVKSESVRNIRPGDTLVLPAECGGWKVFGHVPEEAAKHIDMGDAANLRARAQPILRLHPRLLKDWPDFPGKGKLLTLIDLPDPNTNADATSGDDPAPSLAERIGEPEFITQLQEALTDLAGANLGQHWQWLADLAQVFADEEALADHLTEYPAASQTATGSLEGQPDATKAEVAICLRGSRALLAEQLEKPERAKRFENYLRVRREVFSGDDDGSSGDAEIGLSEHTEHVTKQLARFTARVLPEAARKDFYLAARLHDLGKADPRFQALLRNGTWRGGGRLLAKSDLLPAGWQAYVAARDRAGYPVGGRHELLSVRMAQNAGDLLATAIDEDLVLHLIASHHGYCRPFAPVINDLQPMDVPVTAEGREFAASSRTGLEHLDGGVPERFWRLVRRYGWWGLAYLESLLRLADHRASEAEERNQKKRAR